jgi:hypothetical protein
MIALGIIAYAAIGVCAAAFRAYRDPFIFAREELKGYRTRTLFYTEAVAAHFFFWPVALPITGLAAAMEHWRERGERAVVAERVRALQAERDAQEIERIIAEAKL